MIILRDEFLCAWFIKILICGCVGSIVVYIVG